VRALICKPVKFLKRSPHALPRYTLVACVASIVAIQAGAAYAQTPTSPEPSGSTLSAPALKTDSPVRYPAKAIAEKDFDRLTVVLVLEITTEGRVASVTLDSASSDADPTGPNAGINQRAVDHGFAEEAMGAAKNLVFTPASRNGVPIAAKIKYRYRFVPPAPLLTGRTLRRENDAPLANVEVVVTDAAGVDHTQVTDAKGQFRFTDLPAGHIELRAQPADADALESEETLAYAEETSLVLRAAPRAPSTPVQVDAGEEQPEEVAVRGDKPPREVLKRSLSRQEMQQIPGTNGDALKAVQALPGVARPLPFNGALIVRGSNDEDTQIFVDGTLIPIIFHFGGLSSVLPTESLERLDFYPGNFSSAFGQGMGGAIDVGLRDPSTDKKFHGMAQLDLIDAKLMLEGPIASGWKFRAAGRRSWFDATFGPALRASQAGISTLPRYYDYQLSVQKDFSANHSFRASFFGSDDGFASISGQGGTASIAVRFWRAQALYRNRISDVTDFRAVAAMGTDHNINVFGATSLDAQQYPATLRSELSYKVATGVRANVGVDLGATPFEYTARFPANALQNADPGGFGTVPEDRYITTKNSGTLFRAGLYTEWELTPQSGTRVVPGLRIDHATNSSSFDFSPRINLRHDLSSGPQSTTLKGALGLFFQPPNYTENDPKFGQAGLKSKRAVHADIGVDQKFSENLKLSVDAFYKKMDRLVVNGLGNAGEGRAYGVETLLRYQNDPRFFGWLSYTISKAERRDTETSNWNLFQFDQTHILTLLGSYELGRGWRTGGRFRLVSGNLYTPTIEGAFDSTTGAYLGAQNAFQNAARLPLFHQLDARVDKVWQFADWRLTFYVDVQNIYNNRAVEAITYNYNYAKSAFVRGLTILPSLGLRAEF
jgi:hypothetical protein